MPLCTNPVMSKHSLTIIIALHTHCVRPAAMRPDFGAGVSSGRAGSGNGGFRRGLYPCANWRSQPVPDYDIIPVLGYHPLASRAAPRPEVSFRFAAPDPIARVAGVGYTSGVDALLADLERPFLERGEGLPPARAARPLAPGPRKLNYTHEDCIDAILANPAVTQNELAARYGYTASWISLIINSDAFQAALAKRRDEVISPELRATVEERFRALITESQKVLHEKLLQPNCPPALALGVLGTASKALGYGARDQNVNINQNTFVVALPPAAATSEDWARGRTIEHAPSDRRSSGADPSPIGIADSRTLPSGTPDAV